MSQDPIDTNQTPAAGSTAGVRSISIVDEMKKSYIDYAMSVIVSRALPDVRDGLKPVQRRILYAMFKEGILPTSRFSKCMGVVGEVLKKYHPHGDMAVYDALARMVQDWTLRYPLIQGQGNFGSVDGDTPAAARYTECRLAKISMRLLKDIDKDTIEFEDNYTGEHREPTVLPTVLPNLLLNGADGIAVGMATKIPPHNLSEVVDALGELLVRGNTAIEDQDFKFSHYSPDDYYEAVNFKVDNSNIKFPDFKSDITTKDIVKHIKGPDFPTSGEIINGKDMVNTYETGKGRVVMRAVTNIEENKGGRFQIVVKELPYQVNKSLLAERLYDLIKLGKIEGVADIRDESAKGEIRLVVEVKKGSNPQILLNKLYKFTELQSVYNMNVVAIVDKKPQVLGLKTILEQFIKHRYQVIIRSSLYEINKNKAHAHILEGLKIALDHIDEIIKIIRASANADVAKKELIKAFKFTDVQAQAILDMQLRKLASLERKKIEDEYNDTLKTIEDLKGLLDSRKRVEEKIKNQLEELKEKYGDKRKTKIKSSGDQDFSDEELITKEDVIITLSKSGYIKRLKTKEFRMQSRGGKGSLGSQTKQGDYVSHIIYCNTHSSIMLFSNKGKVYGIKAHEIPEYSKKSKGLPLVNLLQVDSDELITSLLTKEYLNEGVGFLDEDETQEAEQSSEHNGVNYKYLFMATKKGTVKKVTIDEFDDIRRNGLIAIKLDAGDELLYVRPSAGDSDVLLLSAKARTVRFSESKVRPLSRSSKGMRGINLNPDDYVIMMDIVRVKEDRLMVLSEKGFGKITPLTEFPQKGRGTKGMLGYKVTSKTGSISCARILDHPKKEVIIISEKGKTIRTGLDNIRVAGRVTSGVRVIRLDDGDRVSAMALM